MNELLAEESVSLSDIIGPGPQQFSPVAYYDKHMDCIRIELRDCSITERRFDEVITVLYDNYPEPKQHDRAGLMIKGIKHLFKRLDLPVEGILRVTQILDKLSKEYPELIDTEISRIVAEIELTVNLDDVAA
jgi:hypothetical protein